MRGEYKKEGKKHKHIVAEAIAKYGCASQRLTVYNRIVTRNRDHERACTIPQLVRWNRYVFTLKDYECQNHEKKMN